MRPQKTRAGRAKSARLSIQSLAFIMEQKNLYGIIFLLTCVGVIWVASEWKLLKHTELEGTARYIYAFSAFPVLILLSVLTVIIGAKFTPNLMTALTEVSNSNIPTKLQGLIIVPIFGVIPFTGFMLWRKLIKFIESNSNIDKIR